jgi:hypothetical protein
MDEAPAYLLTAHPCLLIGVDHKQRLGAVTFLATTADRCSSKLFVTDLYHLQIILRRLVDYDQISRLIVVLGLGSQVTFPGAYSAEDLMRLGFAAAAMPAFG